MAVKKKRKNRKQKCGLLSLTVITDVVVFSNDSKRLYGLLNVNLNLNKTLVARTKAQVMEMMT